MADRVANKILALLKKEPGMSKQELARRVKRSVSTVYVKLQRLESAGRLTFGGGKVKFPPKPGVIVIGSRRKEHAVVPEPALRLLPHLADDPQVSKKVLGEKLGCRQETVYSYLHRLEEAGFVKIGRKVVTLRGVARTLLQEQAPAAKIPVSPCPAKLDLALEKAAKIPVLPCPAVQIPPSREAAKIPVSAGSTKLVPSSRQVPKIPVLNVSSLPIYEV